MMLYLNLLSKRLDKNIFSNELKQEFFLNHKNGFYVYAEPKKSKSLKDGIEYVARYCGRPAISENRIINYDGENVTFHYNRHEDNTYVKRTIPAIEFIKLLIQHIPEKHFKMIRYYGLYARHREIDTKLYRAIHKSKHRFIKSFTKWRQDILLSFGYDPLFCPHCKKEMALVEVYYRHKWVSLQELYERTMAKVKCRSA